MEARFELLQKQEDFTSVVFVEFILRRDGSETIISESSAGWIKTSFENNLPVFKATALRDGSRARNPSQGQIRGSPSGVFLDRDAAIKWLKGVYIGDGSHSCSDGMGQGAN